MQLQPSGDQFLIMQPSIRVLMDIASEIMQSSRNASFITADLNFVYVVYKFNQIVYQYILWW